MAVEAEHDDGDGEQRLEVPLEEVHIQPRLRLPLHDLQVRKPTAFRPQQQRFVACRPSRSETASTASSLPSQPHAEELHSIATELGETLCQRTINMCDMPWEPAHFGALVHNDHRGIQEPNHAGRADPVQRAQIPAAHR